MDLHLFPPEASNTKFEVAITGSKSESNRLLILQALYPLLEIDNLSNSDISELIEAKKIKEAEKLVQEWPEEKIRIEKARWGRHNIIKGRIKVELSKDVDASKVTLEEAMTLIEKKTPKKKTKAKTKK